MRFYFSIFFFFFLATESIAADISDSHLRRSLEAHEKIQQFTQSIDETNLSKFADWQLKIGGFFVAIKILHTIGSSELEIIWGGRNLITAANLTKLGIIGLVVLADVAISHFVFHREGILESIVNKALGLRMAFAETRTDFLKTPAGFIEFISYSSEDVKFYLTMDPLLGDVLIETSTRLPTIFNSI